MEKIAFIYPGQGAQEVGMGKDFYETYEVARDLYDRAEEVLDFDIKKVCFEENTDIDKTEYTQSSLVTTELAITKVLEEKGICPDITAGLSLGEYSAIAASGGMEALTAIRLVRKRGLLMANALPEGTGAMSAIMGCKLEVIEEVISNIDGVSVANYNSPAQIVITGESKAVEKANEELAKAGALKVVPLNVSGAFHSPLLKDAGDELKLELDKFQFDKLKVPYITNVDASIVTDIANTKDLLVCQMYSSVMWMQSMEKLIEEGYDTFVEIGPGKTLMKFLKKIDRKIKVYNVSTVEDVDVLLEKLER